MGTNFWWILDIITVAIVVLSIYNCAKKGFSKIVILTAGCVVSVFLSMAVCNSCSEIIYENFIQESSIEGISEALEEYDPAMTFKEVIESSDYGAVLENGRVQKIIKSDDAIIELYEYANQASGAVVDTYENFESDIMTGFTELFSKHLGVKLPPYVTHEITEKISANREFFMETLDVIVDNPEEVPEFIEEKFVRKPALKLVKAFVFIICYFIFMTIIRIVINKTFRFGLLNGFDKLDKAVGGILGAVQGAVMLIIMGVLVKILIHVAESEGSFISYETIEKTYLFRHVFDKIDKF